MINIPQFEFLSQCEINSLKEITAMDPQKKRAALNDLRLSLRMSRPDGARPNSIRTIFNICNCMIGSSLVFFPMIFANSGLFTALIVLFIIGFMSTQTCVLEIFHYKPEENDFPDEVGRILGRKWYYIYSLSSFFLLYIVGMVYFILICNMLYPVLKFILSRFEIVILNQTEISFSEFSYQYLGIIMIFICFILINMKDLKIILRIGQFGVVSIVVLIFFLIVKGIINITNNNVNLDNVVLVTGDISTLCGVFALSFLIHNCVMSIIRNNDNRKINMRDIKVGYFLTGCIYCITGIFGTFAIAGITSYLSSPNTVLDYFEPSWDIAIIQLLVFIQLLTVLPILWYVGRSQFFNIFYKNDPTPKIYSHLLNIIFSICCLVIQILNINPAMIISLDGAIFGYIMVYIIPIKLHLACLYGKNHNYLPITEIKKNLKEIVQNTNDNKNFCVSTHKGMIDKIPKILRYIYYGMFCVLGLAFAILKILNLFKIV